MLSTWPYLLRVTTGTELVRRVIQEMRAAGAQEAALEAETVNAGALAMYEALGFIRDKRLDRCTTDHQSIHHPIVTHATTDVDSVMYAALGFVRSVRLDSASSIITPSITQS